MIGRLENETDFLIDSWLMSCRVLGRQVEAATLNLIAEEARRLGATRLVGEYRPTAKNGMVRAHYSKFNFAVSEQRGDGSVLARLDLAQFVPLATAITVIEGGS